MSTNPSRNAIAKTERRVLVALTVAFIVSLCVQLFVATGEPNTLGLGIHLFMALCLVMLGGRVLKASASAERGKWIVLLAVALTAVVAVLGLRLRGARPETESNSTVYHSLYTLEIRRLVADIDARLAELPKTRWGQAKGNIEHQRTLQREDLSEFLQKSRAALASTEEGERKFAEARSSGINLTELPETSPALKPFLANAGSYQLLREHQSLSENFFRLVHENWNDFHARGIDPTAGEMQPWQTEALRLHREQAATRAKINELLAAP